MKTKQTKIVDTYLPDEKMVEITAAIRDLVVNFTFVPILIYDRLLLKYPYIRGYNALVARIAREEINVLIERNSDMFEEIFFNDLLIYDFVFNYFQQQGNQTGMNWAQQGKLELLNLVEDQNVFELSYTMSGSEQSNNKYDINLLTEQEQITFYKYIKKYGPTVQISELFD